MSNKKLNLEFKVQIRQLLYNFPLRSKYPIYSSLQVIVILFKINDVVFNDLIFHKFMNEGNIEASCIAFMVATFK